PPPAHPPANHSYQAASLLIWAEEELRKPHTQYPLPGAKFLRSSPKENPFEDRTWRTDSTSDNHHLHDCSLYASHQANHPPHLGRRRNAHARNPSLPTCRLAQTSLCRLLLQNSCPPDPQTVSRLRPRPR